MRKNDDHAVLWMAVGLAMFGRRQIKIGYTRADGVRSVRRIEPYEIETKEDGVVLVRALDHRSGQPRTFRLERVDAWRLLRRSFRLVPEDQRGAVCDGLAGYDPDAPVPFAVAGPAEGPVR